MAQSNHNATLPAFDGEEQLAAKVWLATQVASMMGRKMEEGDWTSVYCRAKSIPDTGWSNLSIDVIHDGLGVEQKLLRFSASGEDRFADWDAWDGMARPVPTLPCLSYPTRQRALGELRKAGEIRCLGRGPIPPSIRVFPGRRGCPGSPGQTYDKP